jgi:ATP-binding cassette subfamily F protein uup
LCWGFQNPPLLEHINFQIEKGERVCLLGRNGSGKTTLLQMLSGEILPDSGEIWRQQGLSVASLGQVVPRELAGTVFEVVTGGLNPRGPALAETHRIETILSRTQLAPEAPFADLSTGMKRRALFARALAGEPDILLLDEPTNHLDIETIVWLEDFILRFVKTLLFVTHDRAFLKKIATRVLELDRGSLFSYDCDYETYLQRRQAILEAEELENGRLDKKLSQEEAWIRQGIKARRTRNEGRVRALFRLREARRARREKTGNVTLRLQGASISGKLVIEAERVGFSYGETPVVRDFSTRIMRGDKVGLIGPNGAGKTTLLNILLKNLAPQTGSVRHGTNLEVAYFDQLRVPLDEQKTVRENIGQGNDFVLWNGQQRHVVGYLQDFLFSSEKCRTPVQVLSGGEKNRLMLAKLFARPANVLVLDEPTNDLDTETLELLEELLFDFKGTLLLVSHDRTFLNRVVTSTLVLEGNGQVKEYAGGYDDWLVQKTAPQEGPRSVKDDLRKSVPKSKPRGTLKLGFQEKRELAGLPERIHALEAEQKELYAAGADPFLYKKGKEEVLRIKSQLAQVERDIEQAYRRWEELDEKDQAVSGVGR